MRTESFVREATEADLSSLLPRLRRADRDEIIGITGAPPELALPGCVQFSDTALALCTPDGVVHGLLGVNRLQGGEDVGQVWMFLSDEVFNRKHAFLRRSPVVLEALHKVYPLLTNLVDERNTAHITWLRWLGFTFLRRVELGPFKLPFIEFARLA